MSTPTGRRPGRRWGPKFERQTDDDVLERYKLPNGATFTKLKPGVAKGLDSRFTEELKLKP